MEQFVRFLCINEVNRHTQKEEADMKVKEKAREELENRMNKLEKMVTQKGVGSHYLQKAERVQKNVNIGLAVGLIAATAGLLLWATSDSD